MNDLRTLTCSVASEDSLSPQDGPDTAPSDSARLTSGASASSDDTGQLSLFSMTCEVSTATLLPTPVAYDATPGGPNNHYQGLAQKTSKGLLPTPSVMDSFPFRETVEERQRSDKQVMLVHVANSDLSPQGILASHSHSPGSAWARKMTATYGRRFADYWLSFDRPDSWVRTLLGTSVWVSTTCYLTWKRSATPQGRLLFRLVPSTPRTGEIASGLWGTPTTVEHKQTGENTNYQRMADRSNLAGQVMVISDVSQKLNSAWVSRMMGYPDSWLILDGEEIR